jgi:hypothetical protein
MANENTWTTLQYTHKDLFLTKEMVFDACGFDCTIPEAETESADYAAHTFQLNGKSMVYREAKITPTKIGQFVTIWKRSEEGPIAPFHSTDNIDYFIISTRKDNCFGHFVFPKAVLISKGIVSSNHKEGKRGIRVYPPWDITANKQAQKTQQWQLDYFIEIPTENQMNTALVNKLYGCNN